MRPNFTFRKIFLLLFSFLIFNFSLFISHATIRYVSKTGLSIPPYTSWETAADSIQECINICVFGDTIYVANGVYEEQVVMIPGLSLLGVNSDSCLIDTSNLVQPTDFFAVTVLGNCNLENFKIIVSGSQMGTGVHIKEGTMEVKNIKVENARTGMFSFNANSDIHHNILTNVGRGIVIEAFTYTYKPMVRDNVIYASDDGVKINIGTKPTIRNNVIFLNDDYAKGIWCGIPDTLWIYNNLIISASSNYVGGLINSQLPIFEYDNLLIGIFENGAISGGEYNFIYNNNVMNGSLGIDQRVGSPIIKYNNSWNNEVNYRGFTPDSTNLSVNPMIVNDDTTQGELDFHLQMFSPLIDAGDPTILDKDSTRSDIGLYGGPFGESYIYLDLPPRPPVNFTAQVDSSIITLRWNRNTEADFRYYNLYRDTAANFTIDSSKLLASTEDTFYLHLIPANVESVYFKLTAVDNQGNESNPSEEVEIIITAMNDYPMTINDYRLYQNYPNPFNPTTKIGYRLKERGYVKLYVYDIKGELVSVLVNQTQEAGYYEVEFSVGQDSSPVLASGVYIYQIMVRNEDELPVFSDIKKMLYIK